MRHRRKLHSLTIAAMLSSSAVVAQPLELLPGSVELLPITDESYPFNSAAHQVEPIDLQSYNYTEEEYLFSGVAQVYDWAPNGGYEATPVDQSTYTTRMMVRRPADMSDFSGRVVVEVINMSAGYDWTAMWAALWERVVANGDVYVGVTSKPNVFEGMRQFDPGRYAELEMPNPVPAAEQECGTLPEEGEGFDPNLSRVSENGLAWDMFTQVGALLKSDDERNPIGTPAQRVFFTGESQSGNYALTYFKFFQPKATISRDGQLEPVYDAFLLEAATTPEGVPIRQCATPLPDDDPQQQIPGRGVPLAMINSQWEFFPARGGARKADANTQDDKSVTWELAGSNHGWRWQYLYGDADHADLDRAGLLQGDWSAWTCAAGSPEVPLYMAEKALYEHVIGWVETGEAPPAAELIQLNGDEVAYDESGTALGGLRLPMIEVPVASYGEGRAVLSDGCPEIEPFGGDKLQELYGSREGYLEAFHQSVWENIQNGYLLAEDADELMSVAEAVPFD